jgi:hypothetical protein
VVFVVTVVLAVFPVAMVMLMFSRFAAIPLPVTPYVTVALVPFAVVSARFAAIPLPVTPYVTVVLVPFAVVSAWYGNGDLLR